MTDGTSLAVTTGAVAGTSATDALAVTLTASLNNAVDAVKHFFSSIPNPFSSSTPLPIHDDDSWGGPGPIAPLPDTPTNLTTPDHSNVGGPQQTIYPDNSGVPSTTTPSYPGPPPDVGSTTMLSNNANPTEAAGTSSSQDQPVIPLAGLSKPYASDPVLSELTAKNQEYLQLYQNNTDSAFNDIKQQVLNGRANPSLAVFAPV